MIFEFNSKIIRFFILIYLNLKFNDLQQNAFQTHFKDDKFLF
jgi:hypothetical protein